MSSSITDHKCVVLRYYSIVKVPCRSGPPPLDALGAGATEKMILLLLCLRGSTEWTNTSHQFGFGWESSSRSLMEFYPMEEPASQPSVREIPAGGLCVCSRDPGSFGLTQEVSGHPSRVFVWRSLWRRAQWPDPSLGSLCSPSRGVTHTSPSWRCLHGRAQVPVTNHTKH